MKKVWEPVTVRLEKIVGGGQALGTLDDGRKVFVWGGLPHETVRVQLTKKKRSYCEGKVIEVLEPSDERIEPKDPTSYLSTSPWQIMTQKAEAHYKSALIEEAFELHDIVLPNPITMHGGDPRFGYRNKVEFSWYWDTEKEQLELAFFMRGGKGKVPVQGTSLAHKNVNRLACRIRDHLRMQPIEARSLKTLLIRCDQAGNCVWQLYIKDEVDTNITEDIAASFSAQGGEVIFSDPRSPASRITKRLVRFGNVTLTDSILTVPFKYAAESFFQVNLPIYEQTLSDIRSWLIPETPVVDMYSGVGTIGLTIADHSMTLVEVDPHAVEEMKKNIDVLGKDARAVLAASEQALEYIDSNATIIVDPPRAGLHANVIDRLLEVQPKRIIYLSCNPVTQARDVMRLCERYGILHHQGYNFFPCTPHIEHLVVLDIKP